MSRASRLAMTVVIVGAVAGGFAAPAANATHCITPSKPGNVTATIGGVTTIGTDHTGVGTTTMGVLVCTEPQSIQASTADDPARVGLTGSVTTCGLAGCASTGATGAEAATPVTGIDPPADGNDRMGASVATGSGACVVVRGASTCAAGGVGAAPATSTPPAVDDVLGAAIAEALFWAAWPGVCVDLIEWAGAEDGAVLCAIGLVNSALDRVPG